MVCGLFSLKGYSMAAHPYYMLDVFAEEKYAGNQLAVIRNAADIDTATMQKIANDMHFSETTFILSDELHDGGYDVRIFTPEEEIPFAGHPTIGTAYAIIHEIIRKPVKAVTLNLKVGQIPVSVDDDGVLWMKQKPPVFGRTFKPEELAEAIGVRVSDIRRPLSGTGSIHRPPGRHRAAESYGRAAQRPAKPGSAGPPL